MSNRKDVVYHDHEVKVSASVSWIGHDVGYVKQGYWFQYRHPWEENIHVARSLGTVSTLNTDTTLGEVIKDHIVAAVISDCCDIALERWVDPAWVIRSTPFPPARLLEFMVSDFSDREVAIKRMEDGFPAGYNHYLAGVVPKPDYRWEPAKLVTALYDHNKNSMTPERFKYYFVSLRERSGETIYEHKYVFKLSVMNITRLNSPEARAEYIARNLYGPDAESDEGPGFFHKNGEVYVEVNKVEEIDATSYSILSNFITTI